MGMIKSEEIVAYTGQGIRTVKLLVPTVLHMQNLAILRRNR